MDFNLPQVAVTVSKIFLSSPRSVYVTRINKVISTLGGLCPLALPGPFSLRKDLHILLDAVKSMLPVLYPSDSKFRDKLGFNFSLGNMR